MIVSRTDRWSSGLGDSLLARGLVRARIAESFVGLCVNRISPDSTLQSFRFFDCGSSIVVPPPPHVFLLLSESCSITPNRLFCHT